MPPPDKFKVINSKDDLSLNQINPYLLTPQLNLHTLRSPITYSPYPYKKNLAPPPGIACRIWLTQMGHFLMILGDKNNTIVDWPTPTAYGKSLGKEPTELLMFKGFFNRHFDIPEGPTGLGLNSEKMADFTRQFKGWVQYRQDIEMECRKILTKLYGGPDVRKKKTNEIYDNCPQLVFVCYDTPYNDTEKKEAINALPKDHPLPKEVKYKGKKHTTFRSIITHALEEKFKKNTLSYHGSEHFAPKGLFETAINYIYEGKEPKFVKGNQYKYNVRKLDCLTVMNLTLGAGGLQAIQPNDHLLVKPKGNDYNVFLKYIKKVRSTLRKRRWLGYKSDPVIKEQQWIASIITKNPDLDINYYKNTETKTPKISKLTPIQNINEIPEAIYQGPLEEDTAGHKFSYLKQTAKETAIMNLGPMVSGIATHMILDYFMPNISKVKKEDAVSAIGMLHYAYLEQAQIYKAATGLSWMRTHSRYLVQIPWVWFISQLKQIGQILQFSIAQTFTNASMLCTQLKTGILSISSQINVAVRTTPSMLSLVVSELGKDVAAIALGVKAVAIAIAGLIGYLIGTLLNKTTNYLADKGFITAKATRLTTEGFATLFVGPGANHIWHFNWETGHVEAIEKSGASGDSYTLISLKALAHYKMNGLSLIKSIKDTNIPINGLLTEKEKAFLNQAKKNKNALIKTYHIGIRADQIKPYFYQIIFDREELNKRKKQYKKWHNCKKSKTDVFQPKKSIFALYLQHKITKERFSPDFNKRSDQSPTKIIFLQNLISNKEQEIKDLQSIIGGIAQYTFEGKKLYPKLSKLKKELVLLKKLYRMIDVDKNLKKSLAYYQQNRSWYQSLRMTSANNYWSTDIYLPKDFKGNNGKGFK